MMMSVRFKQDSKNMQLAKKEEREEVKRKAT